MGLVEKLKKISMKIYHVAEMDFVRFETRRLEKGETIIPSEYQGIVEGDNGEKYVWAIEPMQVLNFYHIRRSYIKSEINEIQIRELEEDEAEKRLHSVVGMYKRRITYRFGRKRDKVIVEHSLNRKTKK